MDPIDHGSLNHKKDSNHGSQMRICDPFLASFESVMPAVHSCQVRSARFSRESYKRRDCESVTLHTLAMSSQSTRSESEARAYVQEQE